MGHSGIFEFKLRWAASILSLHLENHYFGKDHMCDLEEIYQHTKFLEEVASFNLLD